MPVAYQAPCRYYRIAPSAVNRCGGRHAAAPVHPALGKSRTGFRTMKKLYVFLGS